MSKRIVRSLAAVVLAACLGTAVDGMFIRPQSAPVDRLITNTEAYIKEHPKDASGYFTLARIHYLAFSRKTDAVGVNQLGQPAQGAALPSLASDQMQGSAEAGKAPSEEELAAHATAAADNYRKAIEMEPKNGTYHLGLASLLDSAAGNPAAALALATPQPTTEAKPLPDRPDLYKALASTTYKDRTDAADKLRTMLPAIAPNLIKQLGVETDAEAKKQLISLIGDASRVTAMEEYATAFDLASPQDLKIQNRPISGLNSLVSYEAATRYPELAKTLTSFAKADELTKMADGKKTLDGTRMGGITPVIFSLEAGKGLADLTAPTATTTFDLDGTGRGFVWPWVEPTTAILAWDPGHTGRITSGWQLFGNVTFNMIWKDGYRALDALDDNRDGVLSGDELAGLVIWYDRNGNGISDPGEVVPIEQTGIKAIKVHPDVPTSGDETAVPTAAKGLMMKDGKVLPTWDWMAGPK